MDRPTPEETQPVLTWRSHAWRLAGCAVISALVWSQAAPAELDSHRLWLWAEVVLGLASYVLVVLRRRAPVTVAVAVALMSTFSGIAAGPATLAAVSVATHRVAWSVAVVGLTNFGAATAYTFLAPIELREPYWIAVLVNAIVNAAMMGWGLYLGSRRELLWTLRQRAARAEQEQDLRISQARGTERARIAREMHDVLAHRITQVSMHSGALAFREDLVADDLRDGLRQIQGKANEALRELRGVLGVLRDDSGEPVDQPQPPFADIEEMVAEARRSGMNRLVRRPGRPGRGAGARRGRAHALPDRAGGAHQRQQARPRRPRGRGGGRRPRARARRGDAQPAGLPPGRRPRGRAGPHRPGRAGRAAWRSPRARPAGLDLRGARLDTVDRMSASPVEPISVLVVDDDALVRSALTLMLGWTRRHPCRR